MKLRNIYEFYQGYGGQSPDLRNGFVKNVVALSGGTIIGQAVVVIASPIITRLYSPADLGILAVYSSMLGMITVISSLRYETAIPLPRKDEDAANIVGLGLFIVIIISLLTGAIGILLGTPITDLMNATELKPYLWLLPMGIAMIGAYQIFAGWAVRKQAYGLVARTKISQALGSVISQIGLGVLNMRPLGLLIGQVIGLASGAVTLIVLFLKRNPGILKAVNPKRIWVIAGRYKKFPAIGAPAAALNSVTIYIPAILLAALYGPHVAGWFAVAQRAIGTPLNLVSQAVSQVYIGNAAPLARTSPEQFAALFRKLSLRLLALGVVLIIPIVLIAPRLFTIIFGPDWGESGAYVPRLAPFFIAQFVSAPLGGTLDILERQTLFFAREAIRAIVILGAFLVILNMKLSPRDAVSVVGLAGLIGYAIYQATIWLAVEQHQATKNKNNNK